MSGRLAVLFAVSGCGRIGFAPFDPTGDGGTGDDAGNQVGHCSGANLLVDDFSGPFSLVRWGESYEDIAGMRSQIGGRARITLQALQATAAYAGFATARSFDLTGDAVIVELATVPNPANPSAESIFLISGESGSANTVELMVSGSALRMRQRNPAVTTINTVTYIPSAHRFLRLSELGGMIEGDVSGDGQTWTSFGSVPAPWDVRYTRVELIGGTFASESAPGLAEWEGVNVGVAPIAGFCPIDAAQGTFTDGSIGPEWTERFGPPGCDESNGRLTLALPGSMVTSCELMSRRTFDLTGRSIVGDVSATTAGPNTLTTFGVAEDLPDNATITNNGGAMMFEVYVGGVLVHQTPALMRPAYSATTHRRWRLRHDATTGTLIAELGNAAGSYVELDRYTGTFPTSDVYITFAAGNNNAAAPGVAELLSLNP